jgi:hypothetical protein
MGMNSSSITKSGYIIKLTNMKAQTLLHPAKRKPLSLSIFFGTKEKNRNTRNKYGRSCGNNIHEQETLTMLDRLPLV